MLMTTRRISANAAAPTAATTNSPISTAPVLRRFIGTSRSGSSGTLRSAGAGASGSTTSAGAASSSVRSIKVSRRPILANSTRATVATKPRYAIKVIATGLDTPNAAFTSIETPTATISAPSTSVTTPDTRPVEDRRRGGLRTRRFDAGASLWSLSTVGVSIVTGSAGPR